MFNANVKTTQISLLALILVLFSHFGQAELPSNEFACQVNTVEGKPGLVLVQADDKQTARAVAARSTAWEIGGTQGKALNVVECIFTASEQFRDSWFQKFYTDFEM